MIVKPKANAKNYSTPSSGRSAADAFGSDAAEGKGGSTGLAKGFQLITRGSYETMDDYAPATPDGKNQSPTRGVGAAVRGTKHGVF